MKLRELASRLPKRSQNPEVTALVGALASIFRQARGLEVSEGEWTPTITAASGTITTKSGTGRYQVIGPLTLFTVTITITTNGTGAGDVRFTLPSTPSQDSVAYGRESSVTGNTLAANINSGSALVGIVEYDNTYPGGDGHVLVVSGFYE